MPGLSMTMSHIALSILRTRALRSRGTRPIESFQSQWPLTRLTQIMNDLNWDDLYIDEYHYEFDPVDEVWRLTELWGEEVLTEDPVSDEIAALLNYIQSFQLPKQTNDSLKFMIDELKKALDMKNLEIEKLRDQLESIGPFKYSSSNGSFPLLMPGVD